LERKKERKKERIIIIIRMTKTIVFTIGNGEA